MGRILRALFLSALITAFLVAVGAAGASHRAAPKPVKGTLKYCNDPTFPPLESTTTSGKPLGFDVDMMAAIAKGWKVKSKLVKTAFGGLLPALGAHRCDVVVSGIFVTPDRVKQFPAVAYMHSHRVLLVQSGNPKRIKTPTDLSGKNVAVQSATKYEAYLKDLNDQFKTQGKSQMNLQSYPKDTDAVAQLIIGRADAVLTQDTEAAFQIGANPGKLAIAYLFPESDTFGIYYRPGDRKLGVGLKSAVKRLKKNGTLKKLALKYKIPAADVK